MGKWLDRARSDDRADSVFSADSANFGAKDTKDTNGTLRQSPVALFASWGSALDGLDLARPPDGWDRAHWSRLCRDAHWLLEGYAATASRDGWTTADLFGFWPRQHGCGGLADRLRGSRSLVMTADRARWRVHDVAHQFNRGAYPDLRPFWEVVR